MRLARRALAWSAALGAVAAALGMSGFLTLPGQESLPFTGAANAAFELTRQDGSRFSSKLLAGRPFAIFFGFTNCPDVCPTTLLTMSNHLRSLGDKADRLQVLFVTVDPERDTAAHLANYLSSFDPRIIGLTGSAEEIRNVARIYRVNYRKVPAGQTYTMDHTATVFLVDARGRLAGTLELEGAEAGQLARLRKLVGE